MRWLDLHDPSLAALESPLVFHALAAALCELRVPVAAPHLQHRVALGKSHPQHRAAALWLLRDGQQSAVVIVAGSAHHGKPVGLRDNVCAVASAALCSASHAHHAKNQVALRLALVRPRAGRGVPLVLTSREVSPNRADLVFR